MHKLSHLLQEEYSEKPLILMGHSMGSFLARSYCAKYGNELAGAVFMGTCGNPGKAVLSVERAVAEGKIRRLGKKAHDPLFAKLSTERFNHYFAPVQTPNDWVTSDPGEAKRYTEDPLCGFDLTVSAYRDILDLQAEISAPEWFERVPKELNIFLLAGQKDPVGNFGKGVRWVAEKLKKTGHQVRLVLYPEAVSYTHLEGKQKQIRLSTNGGGCGKIAAACCLFLLEPVLFSERQVRYSRDAVCNFRFGMEWNLQQTLKGFYQ